MFDLSWTELLLIAVVAIIFIGPKELPAALRTLGRWAGKARGMAREFQNSVDDMIRESELDELRKEVRKIESGEYEREIEKTLDPKGEIGEALQAPDISGLPASPPESQQDSGAPPATSSSEDPAPAKTTG